MNMIIELDRDAETTVDNYVSDMDSVDASVKDDKDSFVITLELGVQVVCSRFTLRDLRDEINKALGEELDNM